jgi:hypothetical protein
VHILADMLRSGHAALQDLTAMHQDFRDSVSAGLQHRHMPPDNRQQQQDNGTGEFQPRAQQGDAWGVPDVPPSLQAYLERSRQRGELPQPRPALRLAKR